MKQISTANSQDSKESSENIVQPVKGTGDTGVFLFPRRQAISNILAFSKAYKVMRSELLGNIELILN